MASSSFSFSFWADGRDWEYREASWLPPHVELGARLVLARTLRRLGSGGLPGSRANFVLIPVYCWLRRVVAGWRLPPPLHIVPRARAAPPFCTPGSTLSTPLPFVAAVRLCRLGGQGGPDSRRPGCPLCTISGSCCGRTGAAGWPHTAGTALIGV